MTQNETVLKIAAALANTRSGRRGAPSISNVLDILPSHLPKEIIEDAEAVFSVVATLAKERDENNAAFEQSFKDSKMLEQTVERILGDIKSLKSNLARKDAALQRLIKAEVRSRQKFDAQEIDEIEAAIEQAREALSPSSGNGCDLIAAERRRQIEGKGFSPAHDDRHSRREMASAALCYIKHYVERAWVIDNELGLNVTPYTYMSVACPWEWPEDWDVNWWKPEGKISDLVRAGALIAAEIDRLQRAEQSGEGKESGQ